MRKKPSDLTKILGFIALRPRSIAEVRDRLVRYHAEHIEDILTSLEENRLLDDARFASWYVASRAHSKPRSLSILRLELRAKGVDNAIISEVLTRDIEVESLANLIRKKSRTLSPEKLISYLVKQGFPYNKVRAQLDEIGFSE